jgi:hypothetical protein
VVLVLAAAWGFAPSSRNRTAATVTAATIAAIVRIRRATAIFAKPPLVLGDYLAA